MAQTIQEDYGNESVTLLCVLKGGFRFTQDLMTAISEIGRCAGIVSCLSAILFIVRLFPVGKIAEKAVCIFDNMALYYMALYFECRINKITILPTWVRVIH